MENGAHLTLALLANNAPELVEIGIATDAIFAVIIMVVLVNKIYRTFNTVDAKQLNEFEGVTLCMNNGYCVISRTFSHRFESFALRGTKNRTVCTAFHITGLI